MPPGRRVAAARLAGQETDGRGSQAVASRASAIEGCRALHAMREELRHLADLLPEAGLSRVGPQTEVTFLRAAPELAAGSLGHGACGCGQQALVGSFGRARLGTIAAWPMTKISPLASGT